MDDVPAILYHYTSFDVFRKIMESERVRATHYSELNDTSEIVMAQEILARSLEAYNSSTHPDTIPFLSEVVAWFGRGELNTFLFSLSEESDSLYQWRAYCPEGGVAIGFRPQALDVHFRTESRTTEDNGSWGLESWELVKCRYLSPDDSIDMQPFLSNIDRVIREISQEPHVSVRDWKGIILGHSAYSEVEKFCCSIKHRAYASEKEWRNFSTLGKKTPLTVQLDERNRRFVEMPFVARDVIEEVVISPHGDERQGRSLAQHFKDSMGLSYEIKYSEIPFRT